MSKARLSAARSARKFCLWCQGDGRSLVEGCPAAECPLHPFRMGTEQDQRAVARAIRAFCLQCAGDEETVRECPAGEPYGIHEPCPLFGYRFGRLPRKAKRKKKAPEKSGARSVMGRLPGLEFPGGGES